MICRRRCHMGVATDVSENYLDCLDVPAEIIYVSDTGDRLPVHRSFGLTDLFLLLFVSFFFFLDETRTCTCSNNVKGSLSFPVFKRNEEIRSIRETTFKGKYNLLFVKIRS